MAYKELEVWQMARDLAVDIHSMTIKELPKFEMFEVGRQIRKSIKSVKSNIVEGYGRRHYKQEFIRFLYFALASNDETLDHLDTLFATQSLKDKSLYDDLQSRLRTLGKKLHHFISSVGESHISPK